MKKLTNLEIKEYLFQMLKAFTAFCNDNNIKYTLCGGTLLGAVRHKDFIPWDDDLDVFVSRADYERLNELLKDQDILDRYGLLSRENKGHTLPYARLIDKKTEIKMEYSNYIKYLWLDIFPLDNIPDDDTEAHKIVNSVLRNKFFRIRSVAYLGKGKSFIRTLVKIPFVIIAKILGPEFFDNRLYQLCMKYKNENTKRIGNLSWIVNFGEILDRDQFENRELVSFHGQEFYAMSRWDDYLRGLYGDYMKLPPKSAQVNHSLCVYVEE